MKSRDIKLIDRRGGTQQCLDITPEDVGKYAIIAGDPKRIQLIAEHLEDARELGNKREFVTMGGTYKGVYVVASSHGIGTAGASIVVEELVNIGVTHIIRVGTTAALQEGIEPGDITISTGVMRNDGVTPFFVKKEFPAVPDHFLTHALIEAALEMKKDMPFKLFVGPNACDEAFYAETPELIDMLSRQHHLINVDMESAAVFTIGHLRGIRTGFVAAVAANLLTDEKGRTIYERVKINEAIEIALEALYRMDQDQTLAGQIDQPRYAD
jgi:uridine phosphorylase